MSSGSEQKGSACHAWKSELLWETLLEFKAEKWQTHSGNTEEYDTKARWAYLASTSIVQYSGSQSLWFRSPGNISQCLDIFGCHTRRDGDGLVLLASSEQKPEMLLNILQCTEQCPQRIHWPKMSVVPRLRNPGPVRSKEALRIKRGIFRVDQVGLKNLYMSEWGQR